MPVVTTTQNQTKNGTGGSSNGQSDDSQPQTNGTPFDYTGNLISGLIRNGLWETDRTIIATKDYKVDLVKIKTPETKKGVTDFSVPQPMIDKDPQLIELVILSESMKDEERQYWFNLSEVMNTGQVEKLRDILVRERIRLVEIDFKYGKLKIDPVQAARKAKEMAENRAKEKQLLAKREAQSMADESPADDILAELDFA